MIKFAYNPYTNDFIDCPSLHHSVALRKQGKQAQFYEYIRGIISDGILYLRTYYPYKDLDRCTLDHINTVSKAILQANHKTILQYTKQVYNIRPKKTVYNVTNNLLKRLNIRPL